MGDEPFLRSHCPGGEGCYCDGAEHVYVRDRSRTVTPARQTRSTRTRRASNLGADVVSISKHNSYSKKTLMEEAPVVRSSKINEVIRRSQRSRAADPPASNKYLAYSSDEEYEEFISQPKTDYTYARSVSYKAISPEQVTPPNMSRRCLHSLDDTSSHTADYSRLAVDRYDAAASSRGAHDYQLEVSSFTTTTATTTTSKVVDSLPANGAAGTSSSSSVATSLRSLTFVAEGDSSPPTESSSSPPVIRQKPFRLGALHQISHGLDFDSGDEEWMENNNISKSSLSQSSSLLHQRKTRRSVRSVLTSVLTTLLYPLTLLWVMACGAGARLMTAVRPRAAAPPPPEPAQFSRWVRRQGQPRPGGAGAGFQAHYRAGAGVVQPQRRSLLNRAAVAVTSTVTTVTTTVVTLLWWINPARLVAAAGLAGRAAAAAVVGRPIAWARTAGEVADVPHRLAALLHWLSPVTWARAGGRAAWACWRAAAAVAGWAGRRLYAGQRSAVAAAAYLNPLSWTEAAWVGVDGSRRVSAALHWLSPLTWLKTASTLVGRPLSAAAAAGRSVQPVGWARAAAIAVVSAVQWGGTAAAGAGRRVWRSVWPAAHGKPTWLSPVRGATLTEQGKRGRRRQLCLCLLLPLLLLGLLLIPLLWGLYCEDDVAGEVEESAVLRQLAAAPHTAWRIFRDTAVYVGTSTADTASGLYGYLALMGSSARMAAPPANQDTPEPDRQPAPVPMFVPPPPAATPGESLTQVYAQLSVLEGKLATLHADFQSCRAASEHASQPSSVRAALGLAATAPLLTAEQLAAAEQRQSEQLSQLDGQLTAQLVAVRRQLEERAAAAATGRTADAAQLTRLEAGLAELHGTAALLQQLQTVDRQAQQRTAGLTAEVGQLQQDFSDLHRTLLVVQESLKQIRSCCNRTDPDWSALLSQRLRDMEQQLDDRLKVYAATIKHDLTSDSAAAVAAVGGVSRDDVMAIARQTVALYDADKTGKFDYALESAGGSIINTRCTESYSIKSARISVLGIPLWYPSNNPRIIVQPHMSPGECFAFRGQGYFVIALSRRIVPSGFVMEHISRNLTPSAVIDSAPREFTVMGLKDPSDQDGVVLGTYEYREKGPPLQEFPVMSPSATDYHLVELRIQSNWGHPDYTCLYRFRVHGTPAQPDAR